MDDIESQRDEILALESILDQDRIKVMDNEGQQIAGYIYIKPEIDTITVQAEKAGKIQQCTVKHLPPIELHFNLPKDYPSTSPPGFTLVCKWLKHNQVEIVR